MSFCSHEDAIMKISTSVSPKRPLLLLAWTTLLFSVSGCAMLLGIEERTEEKAGDGVVDKETAVATTPLCVKYCNEVMKNCEGGNAVYSSRTSCINTCNALPAGEAAEASGNSIECRLRRAQGAASTPSEECVAAGPGGDAGGDAGCGSNCESWCSMLKTECPDDYGILDDCMSACKSIPDEGGFDVNGSYTRDDIQCRLIHLGAVAGDPESPHCSHARYFAAEKCIPQADDQPTCEIYCDTVMANCRGEDAAYESRKDCLATCEVFDVGTLADRTENTLGCRIYHARSSSQTPATHCNHAGPTGDGHCGVISKTEDTGNCASYCSLLQAGCADEFDAEGYADGDACIAACVVDFEDSGAAIESLYDIESARSKDSLQCRVYYTVLALGGDAEACAMAKPSGTCK